MSPAKLLALIVITGSLAMPIALSLLTAQSQLAADRFFEQTASPVSPDVEGWSRSSLPGTETKQSLARGFVRSDGTEGGIIVTRGTAFTNAHELYWCMKGRGWQILGEKPVNLDLAGKPLNATLISYHKPESNQDMLSLIWYQCQGKTIDHLSHRVSTQFRLASVFKQANPLFREVRVFVSDSGNRKHDLACLKELARAAYETPL